MKHPRSREITLDFSLVETEGSTTLADLDALLQRSGFEDYVILARLARRSSSRGLRTDAVVQVGSARKRRSISRRLRSLVSWWWEPPPRRK